MGRLHHVIEPIVGFTFLPVDRSIYLDGRSIHPVLDCLRWVYGSFLGDGGLRGSDFTAEALNRFAIQL